MNKDKYQNNTIYNPLLYVIRQYLAIEDHNDEDSYIEYQRKLVIFYLNKSNDCWAILNEMIQKYTKEELENILTETDLYGWTALHYACRYRMTKVAHFIIDNIHTESNLYKLSNTELTPLIVCCKSKNSGLKSIFKKIIEKTANEDHLYLGKNHALQFCLLNNDTEKAQMILEKTLDEKNIYKLGLRYTSLILSLEKGMPDIASTIIEKTKKESNLYIPMYNGAKNAFYYLSKMHYLELPLQTLFKKYERINYLRRKTFEWVISKHKHGNKFHSEDIIRYILEFISYPPEFICYQKSL